MPNAIAYIALLGYPFIAVFFFRIWSVPTAVAATLLGGYLFLPSEPTFDFPLLPVLDKHSIPALVAMSMATLAVATAKADAAQMKRRGMKVIDQDHMLQGWLPRGKVPLICLGLFVSTAIGTMLTNGDSIRITATNYLPGLRVYDIFSMLLGIAFTIPPFLLGRKFFFQEEHHAKLLFVFAVCGLVYSFFALIEIRMSPQMNTWIYGYFPHSFLQHVRNGGYRPLVFLQHGLWLAVFQAMAMTAALALSRYVDKKHRTKWLLAALWIFGVMFLSRSLGGFALALMMLVVILALPGRMVGFVCVSLVAISLLYPIMRLIGIFPLDSIVSAASLISQDRAGSLNFRFVNEEQLIAKGMDKLLFGWGGWGRNAIYDTSSGKSLSIVDSQWIISFGVGGLVGYMSEFGLYITGLLAVGFGLTRREIPMVTRGIMAMLTINLVDMLVNATATSATWLLAGALTGYLEACRSRRPMPTAPVAEPEKTAEKGRPRKGERRPARARATPVVEVVSDAEARPIHQYTRQKTKHVRGAKA